MRTKDSRLWSALAWTVLFGAVILGGMLLAVLIALGRVKVHHLERIPRRRRILYAPNHPGMLEPLLLGLLFSRPLPSLRSWPIPWATPDKRNFYDKWYWAWTRLRSIPFPRGDDRGEIRAIGKCARVLRAGFRLVLFGESGRTSSNNTDGTIPVRVQSPSGQHEVREFKAGIGRMLLDMREECVIVPVWVEGTDTVIPRGHWVPRFWRAQITVTIGKPMVYQRPNGRLPKSQRREAARVIAKQIETAVLATAEERKPTKRGGRKRRPSSPQPEWLVF